MADPKHAGPHTEDAGGRPEESGFAISPALAATVALLVAGLAAVGVSGELLARAVRNEPVHFAGALTLALLAVTVLVVRPLWRAGKRGPAVGIGVVCLLAVGAIVLGAASLDVREKPAISVSAEPSDSGGFVVTVDARTAGLRSDEDLLVQVVALRNYPASESDYRGNSPAAADGTEVMSVEQACSFSALTLAPRYSPPGAVGPLLAWQQAGPDSDGNSAVSFTLHVEAGYAGVCAAAIDSRPSPSFPGRVFDGIQSLLGLPTGTEDRVSNALVRFG